VRDMDLRHKFPVVIVVGVPGVGKTTVLSLAMEKFKQLNIDVLVLNYGDYMFKALSEKGIVKSRDEVRRLSIRTQLEHQELAAELLINDAKAKLKNGGVLIVDTHAVIKTSIGYWPGLPSHVVYKLKPDLIAIVEAPVKDIVARQLKDTTRYRKDLAKAELVDELLKLTRYFAIASATLVGASVAIIKNFEGKANEAAEELVKIVRTLL